MSSLNPSSYIVLGFLDCHGPATSYELKQWADCSIHYFWEFSRTQLYKEPARLAHLKLLFETQQKTGRRKRVFTITESGRAALSAWMKEPANQSTELRDLGLLKLYFAGRGTSEDLLRLTQDQLTAHIKRYDEYQAIEVDLKNNTDTKFAKATLRMGAMYEEMAISFWRDIQKNIDKYL